MQEAAELAGTVVFAISGVFAVAGRRLDWFGAVVVGMAAALGGGSIRDVILGDVPVFWIDDTYYMLAAFLGAIGALVLAYLLSGLSARAFEEILQIADAAGLALFAVVGARIALDLGFDPEVAVVTAVISGTGGGVIRDLLADRTPLVLRNEIYATAALAGAVVFVGLQELTDLEEPLPGTIAALLVFGLRMLAIRREWSLPTFAREDSG